MLIELILTTQISANILSNILVGTQIGVDTIDSFKQIDKKHALLCQSERLALTIGSAELTKYLVHKKRPDGSDNKSFYSEHTSIAFISSGWKWQIGIPIAITTGGLRITAKKHDIIDVSVGTITGLLIGKICHK